MNDALVKMHSNGETWSTFVKMIATDSALLREAKVSCVLTTCVILNGGGGTLRQSSFGPTLN